MCSVIPLCALVGLPCILFLQFFVPTLECQKKGGKVLYPPSLIHEKESVSPTMLERVEGAVPKKKEETTSPVAQGVYESPA